MALDCVSLGRQDEEKLNEMVEGLARRRAAEGSWKAQEEARAAREASERGTTGKLWLLLQVQ